jgi:signal transduction histidine kinase
MPAKARRRLKPLPWSSPLQPIGAFWRSLGIFDRFKVVFSLFLLAVMVLLGVAVNGIVVQAAAEHAAEEGSIFLGGMVQPLISPEGAEEILDESAKEALDRLLPQAYLSEDNVTVNFVLIRIWSMEGELLYSLNESQMEVARPTAAIEMARNDTYVRLKPESDGIDPLMSRNPAEELIAMAAPLHRIGGSEVVAVLETYQDRAFISGELRQWRASTWSVIGLVSAILLGCLYLFAVRANSTIDAQQKELVEHLEGARRLAQENAKLTAAAEASRSRISQSNDRYLERIGSDIHDGPLQTLSALLMSLRALSASKRDRETVPTTSSTGPVSLALELYDELREIAAGLVLPDIKQGSLENAILQAAIRHEQKTGTSVYYRSRGLPENVADTVKVNCYRILQEGLTNAYKHAGGVEQSVYVVATPTHLRLIITDSGPGLGTPPKGGRRLGLVGIRNRVAALKGQLEIRSAPGLGTRLRVTIPLVGQEGYDEDQDVSSS